MDIPVRCRGALAEICDEVVSRIYGVNTPSYGVSTAVEKADVHIHFGPGHRYKKSVFKGSCPFRALRSSYPFLEEGGERGGEKGVACGSISHGDLPVTL